jgi:hypothetical protein
MSDRYFKFFIFLLPFLMKTLFLPFVISIAGYRGKKQEFKGLFAFEGVAEPDPGGPEEYIFREF